MIKIKLLLIVTTLVVILSLTVLYFSATVEATAMKNQYKTPEYVILASEVRAEVAKNLSQ